MKVYIAAASTDMERAKHWMSKLRLAGIEVVNRWIAKIEEVGEANPRGDNVSFVRQEAAAQNEADIDSAHVLWFLVPKEAPGRGGYWESGYARKAKKHLVFSGDTQQSVFTSQGKEFADDLDAFADICRYAREEFAKPSVLHR